MSSEIRVALEIAGAAGVLLFAAILVLVALMYFLTNAAIFGEPARERRRAKRRARRMKKRRGIDVAADLEQQAGAHTRRRTAAAVAAAVARAELEASVVPYIDAPPHWRTLHRERRLRHRVWRRA
jgi:hypothetical protein